MQSLILRSFSHLVCTTAVIGGLGYLGWKHLDSSVTEKQVNLLKLIDDGVLATPMQVRASAKEGDVEMLEALGELGVDFASAGSDGSNAVHLAMDHGKWSALKEVRKYVGDQDQKDGAGKTPLQKSIESGYVKLAQSFVDAGADVDFGVVADGVELPASVYFLKQEKWKQFNFVIDNAADLESCDADGRSLLQMALEGGQGSVVKKLVENGADFNEISLSGRKMAVELIEHPERYGLDEQALVGLLEEMIKRGLDVEMVDGAGVKLMTIAMREGQTEVFDLLLQHVKKDPSYVWEALSFQQPEILSSLLQSGIRADAVNELGETPLVVVVREGGERGAELVSVLLDNGAEADEVTGSGQRAVFDAVASGKSDIAKVLINHSNGADVHEPMFYPVSEEFRALFGRKGSFDWYCRNVRGLTPLMVAVLSDELYVAEDLIKKGAKRFDQTSAKSFPIQLAADMKNVKMQQLILGVPFEDDEQVRKYVVDLSDQKLYFYKNGKVVKTSRCSTGRREFRTPVGEYVVTDRMKNKVSNIYEDAKMPYFQRFSCSPVGIHQGATYAGFLSHGCIRLSMSDAKYYYTHGKVGDRVTIRK